MSKRLSFITALSVVVWGCGSPPDESCDGAICLEDSGPPPPADAGFDAGVDAAPAACGTTGTMAGACRAGACGGGLTCAIPWGPTIQGMTTPSTLGNVYGFNAATEDPAHPGEYLPTGTPSDVPVNFTGGDGQCTQGCYNATQAMPDDGCGDCATCNNTLGGGGPAFGQLGATGLSVDSSFEGFTLDDHDGICRLDCEFDPATNGGCPSGYTCNPGSNTCTEACVNDAQCTADFGFSRSELFVVVDTGDGSTCNMTTGRCEHTPPAGAAFNSACETSVDCPNDFICIIGGYCASFGCADSSGMAAGPFPCDGECLGYSGNGSLCLPSCTVAADCLPGQACAALNADRTAFACYGVCDLDADCRSDERCELVREDNPDTTDDDSLSVCSFICDPDPTDGTVIADAMPCGTDEACIQATGVDHGFCQAINQLCGDDGDCNADQACEVVDVDLLGRCVDGCTVDTDCTSGTAECVIQSGSTTGVCREPGGVCASSPLFNDGSVRQALLGDGQCIASQECSSTMAGELGTCVDRP